MPTRRHVSILAAAAVSLGLASLGESPEDPPAPPGAGPLVPAAAVHDLRAPAVLREAPLPAISRGPFDPQFPARVCAELDAALRPPGPPGPRVPARIEGWGGFLARLPEIQRFLRWISLDGGSPEDYPGDLRKRLVGCDRAFAAAGLPQPLYPFLYMKPLAEPLTIPVWAPGQGRAERTRTGRGWFSLALRCLDAARAASRTTPEDPDPGRLRSDLTPAARHLHAALYAAARSIRAEAATRDALACHLAEALPELAGLWSSYLATLDLRTLLGSTPPRAAGALLQAACLARRRAVDEARGLPVGELDARRRELLMDAGAHEDPAAPDAAWRYTLVWRLRSAEATARAPTGSP